MIKKVIISPSAVYLAEYIQSLGVDVYTDYCNFSVDKRISDHADVSYFFDAQDTLFVAKSVEDTIDNFKGVCKNIVIVQDNQSENYPSDVQLNCVAVGKHFICNKKTVSKLILEHMDKLGFEIINVNQGYTKCSILPVTDNAIITDDLSVYEACQKHNIDVLLVSKGNVNLQGYSYGFIGGTGGKISDNLILFNGDIRNHYDCEKIEVFLKQHNIDWVCTAGELIDIGSIIPLYKV